MEKIKKFFFEVFFRIALGAELAAAWIIVLISMLFLVAICGPEETCKYLAKVGRYMAKHFSIWE